MLHLRRLALLGMAGWLIFGGSQPGMAAPVRDLCQAPDDVAGAIAALPKVAAVMKQGGVLRILAVGSATMFGPDASLTPGTVTSQSLAPEPRPPVVPTPPATGPAAKPLTQEASQRAFPIQMAKALKGSVPGLDVQVVVRGGRGMSAAEMLAIIEKELKTGVFQLVLWQTGTVEAVRNAAPGEFAQVLVSGAEAVDAAGANLILIDPQYSRFLQTNSNLDPYAQALQQTAAMPGVILFHRFDLMRSWAADGQIDLERTPKADRTKMVDALHSCLGAHLARMVISGARS